MNHETVIFLGIMVTVAALMFIWQTGALFLREEKRANAAEKDAAVWKAKAEMHLENTKDVHAWGRENLDLLRAANAFNRELVEVITRMQREGFTVMESDLYEEEEPEGDTSESEAYRSGWLKTATQPESHLKPLSQRIHETSMERHLEQREDRGVITQEDHDLAKQLGDEVRTKRSLSSYLEGVGPYP